jgi:hypothetical protein
MRHETILTLHGGVIAMNSKSQNVFGIASETVNRGRDALVESGQSFAGSPEPLLRKVQSQVNWPAGTRK